MAADFFEPLQLYNQTLPKIMYSRFKTEAGHATCHSEVFHPSGGFGDYGLVCNRISGRRAGTNYILSRNFWGGTNPNGAVFLLNGSCTNGNDGAFSGAALASQALSELSQTTTQTTTKEVGKAIVERREQERERMRRPARPAREVPREKRSQLRSCVRSLHRLRSNLPPDLGPDSSLWRLSEEGRCWAWRPNLLLLASPATAPIPFNGFSLTSRLTLTAGRARLALWPALISPPRVFFLGSSQG